MMDRQRILILAIFESILLLVISGIGFYFSTVAMEDIIGQKITLYIQEEAGMMQGWLRQKGAKAEYVANLYTSFNGDPNYIQDRRYLALPENDLDTLELALGNEEGLFTAWRKPSDYAGSDPRVRPWYILSKEKQTLIYTEPFIDLGTKKPVISAAAPYFINGNFAGAICADISLDVFKQVVSGIQYDDAGKAFIFNGDGQIIISMEDPVFFDLKNKVYFRDNFDSIVQNKVGFFQFREEGKDKLFIYSSIDQLGWYLGFTIPEEVVYKTLHSLQFCYFILIVVGISICGWMFYSMYNSFKLR